MSVSDSVTIPANPTTGGLEYIPLGGNGFTAPQSAYTVSIAVVSDASGGTSTLTINFDDQYLSLVSFVQTTVTASSADVPSRRTLTMSTFDALHDATDCQQGEGTTAARIWKPPGVMGKVGIGFTPNCVSRIANTDTETHFLGIRIYNFNVRARETTPLALLLQNLPR